MRLPRRQRAEPTQPAYSEKPKDIRPSSWWAPTGNQMVEMMPNTAEETHTQWAHKRIWR